MGENGIVIPLKAGHLSPTCETQFKQRFAGGPDGVPHWNAGLIALQYD